MVKVIMGLKGTGKTKQLIELVRKAAEVEDGSVICMEKSPKLTYDIPHTVRLIEMDDYSVNGYDYMKGFISGLHAANYDMTHIFIDSLLRIVGRDVDGDTAPFLDWCDSFGKRENVKFTMMISADTALAGEGIKKYF
ncbi:MAG: hypothetical protein LBJ84_02480 [Oscillospiraceae bacterium]|jgi:Flp pilus assembly CpaF family ATPase|nr:hypothetical protein [Oscillospiraceae bacterium]